MRFVTIVLLIFIPSVVLAVLPESVREMEGALLKGDGPTAHESAHHSDMSALNEVHRNYVSCVRARFESSPQPNFNLEPLAREVIWIYQNYWYNSFLDPANRHQYEEDLRHALQKLLEIPEDKDFAFTEGKLSERLTNKGYIALLGRTPPLRELMLWRRQTSRNFEVVLPDDRYVSHVYLLDDFSSLGWTAWATCDHRATGGWATEKALFAPVPRYKHGIQGSEFKAVFLTHETQHLVDKNRFEKMKPWELEYRAKLAELWAADANVASERISKFQDSQSDDPALAHSFANRQVLIDLTKYLSKDVAVATLSELHAAAKALLIADSKKRRVHNS